MTEDTMTPTDARSEMHHDARQENVGVQWQNLASYRKDLIEETNLLYKPSVSDCQNIMLLDMSISDIARAHGLLPQTLQSYISRNHAKLVEFREDLRSILGYVKKGRKKKYKKSELKEIATAYLSDTAATDGQPAATPEGEEKSISRRTARAYAVEKRYSPALPLIEQGKTAGEVAKQIGVLTKHLMKWLERNYPLMAELARQNEWVVLPNGIKVSRKKWEKYQEAVKEFCTTDEPLASIAKRHKLSNFSFWAFMEHAMPEVMEQRRQKKRDRKHSSTDKGQTGG